MNLKNARVLIAAQYAAPYEGNFIASLRNLKNRLSKEYNAICSFVFPRDMELQPWAKSFMSDNEVFLTGSNKCLISRTEAEDILIKVKPILVYTHFEGYDMPFARAIHKLDIPVHMIWHMHDALAFHSNPLKAAYQCYTFLDIMAFQCCTSAISGSLLILSECAGMNWIS